MKWRVVAALALVCVGGIPALSAAAGRTRSAGRSVSVSPAAGSPVTRFVVSFRAPDSTGAQGTSVRRYSVAVAGPRRRGCDSNASVGAPAARKGQLVRVSLAPGSGGWCRGVLHGAVEELVSPACSPPPAMCPLYVVVLRRIGGFTFRVR